MRNNGRLGMLLLVGSLIFAPASGPLSTPEREGDGDRPLAARMLAPTFSEATGPQGRLLVHPHRSSQEPRRPSHELVGAILALALLGSFLVPSERVVPTVRRNRTRIRLISPFLRAPPPAG